MPPFDVDDVLVEIGEFGPRQKLIYGASCLFQSVAAWFAILPTYSSHVGDQLWECLPEAEAQAVLAVGGGGAAAEDFARCRNATAMPNGPISTAYCGLAHSTWRFIEPGASIATEWRLLCDHEYLAKLPTSLYFAGFGVGVAAFGGLSDRLGRRPVFLSGAAATVLVGLAESASPSLLVYSALRTVLGAI